MGSAASKQAPQAARKLANTKSAPAAASAAASAAQSAASAAGTNAANETGSTPLANKTKFEKFVPHDKQTAEATQGRTFY